MKNAPSLSKAPHSVEIRTFSSIHRSLPNAERIEIRSNKYPRLGIRNRGICHAS
jgi:hypothetical protein